MYKSVIGAMVCEYSEIIKFGITHEVREYLLIVVWGLILDWNRPESLICESWSRKSCIGELTLLFVIWDTWKLIKNDVKF